MDIKSIVKIEQIPYLPISFFKTQEIKTGIFTEQLLFESSGTTRETPSRHFVKETAIYEQSLLTGFKQYYGDPEQYTFLALLPSYLERKNASLVYMAKTLMAKSGKKHYGFYIDEWEKLHQTLILLEAKKQKSLLLGVTFALLDFAEHYSISLNNTIVMETGGMKGRRKELTRNEVHEILKKQFGLTSIHSEYGMTELLSQAYALSDGIFRCQKTMKVSVRDIYDPLEVKQEGTGCINVIDLANIYSCSFIATDDIGRIYADNSFEILGRIDNAAIRGCNLMVE